MKGLCILGATGSIGVSTLDVVARHPDLYKVVALTANNNIDLLFNQCVTHRPEMVVVADEIKAAAFSEKIAHTPLAGTKVLSGAPALAEAATLDNVDSVMAAIVGAAGLLPTLAAAKAGKTVLLANKEALVMSGDIFMQAIAESGAVLLPIDSEHNAIFQCMPAGYTTGVTDKKARRILLTASGGPFRQTPVADLVQVTPEQAVAHPNWDMGKKISPEGQLEESCDGADGQFVGMTVCSPEQIRVFGFRVFFEKGQLNDACAFIEPEWIGLVLPIHGARRSGIALVMMLGFLVVAVNCAKVGGVHPDLLKRLVVGELRYLSALGRRGYFGRITHWNQEHQFISRRHFEDCAGLVVIKQADHDRSQPEAVGGQTNVLTGNSEIKHKPVAELGGDLILVKSGAFQFAANRQNHRSLDEGPGRRLSFFGQGRLQIRFDLWIRDDDDLPALGVGPGGRPFYRLQQGIELFPGDRRFFVFANTSSRFNNIHKILHSQFLHLSSQQVRSPASRLPFSGHPVLPSRFS